MMIKNQNELNRIYDYFDELFPHAGCELIYHTDYELLMAVMLSAQTTDKSVNKVTKELFGLYPSLNDLAKAKIDDVEKCIKSIGMYHQKAINLIKIAQILLSKFDGRVPSDKEDLMSLPGVGNKTANVVRMELFGIPEMAVDTHVARISKRLGFASSSDDVRAVEKKLRQQLQQSQYIKIHHQMIHFGRYYCKAMSPKCLDCKIADICHYKNR